jgi:hypothetical protein
MLVSFRNSASRDLPCPPDSTSIQPGLRSTATFNDAAQPSGLKKYQSGWFMYLESQQRAAEAQKSSTATFFRKLVPEKCPIASTFRTSIAQIPKTLI